MIPDQLASEKPADLDLYCFPNRIHISGLSMRMVKLVCNCDRRELISSYHNQIFY